MEAENTGGVSPSWPVEGIVAEGSSTSWTGDRWSHKSLLALHLGLSVAAPGIGEWMGQRVRTSPVIYVDFNGSIESFCHRAVAVAEGLLCLDSRSPTLGDFHYLGRLPPGGPLSPVDALARAAQRPRGLLGPSLSSAGVGKISRNRPFREPVCMGLFHRGVNVCRPDGPVSRYLSGFGGFSRRICALVLFGVLSRVFLLLGIVLLDGCSRGVWRLPSRGTRPGFLREVRAW
jgi:hypothetical protein